MAKTQKLTMAAFTLDRAQSIKALRDSVKRVTDNKDQFAMAYAAANSVAKTAQLDGEVYMYAEPSVWYGWKDDCEFSLTANITMMKVDSLKEGRVPAVLAAAEKAGFEFDLTRDYVSESYAQREFKATGNFNGVRTRLNITAELQEDAANCKRVQTGTEIREVAKYVIVCE